MLITFSLKLLCRSEVARHCDASSSWRASLPWIFFFSSFLKVESKSMYFRPDRNNLCLFK